MTTLSPRRPARRSAALLCLSLGLAGAQSAPIKTQSVAVTPKSGITVQTIVATPKEGEILPEIPPTSAPLDLPSLVSERGFVPENEETNNFLKTVCPNDEGASPNAAPNKNKSFGLNGFSIDGLDSMVSGLCRIKSSHNEVMRVLNQDSWGVAAQNLVNRVVSMSGVQGNLSQNVQDILLATQNGSLDTFQTISAISQSYRAAQQVNPYRYQPGTSVTTLDNQSMSSDVRGILRADGTLDVNPMDEAVFDTDFMAATQQGSEALRGLGSVFAHQEGTVQALEASARRVSTGIESASVVLGDGQNRLGAIEERINASRSATSMREQTLAQTQLIGDGIRLQAEQGVSILAQMSEQARLTSVTNHLLATQSQKIYEDRLNNANAAIEAYKKSVMDEVSKYEQMAQASQLVTTQYYKSVKGGGMTSYSWSDVTGYTDGFKDPTP